MFCVRARVYFASETKGECLSYLYSVVFCCVYISRGKTTSWEAVSSSAGQETS